MPKVTSELVLKGESGTEIPPPTLKKTALIDLLRFKPLLSESANVNFFSAIGLSKSFSLFSGNWENDEDSPIIRNDVMNIIVLYVNILILQIFI